MILYVNEVKIKYDVKRFIIQDLLLTVNKVSVNF